MADFIKESITKAEQDLEKENLSKVQQEARQLIPFTSSRLNLLSWVLFLFSTIFLSKN